MRIVWAVAGCLLAAALAGCAASPGPSAGPSIAPLAATSAPSGPLPMRWVSSYGTEVRVPKAWRVGALSPNEACVRGGRETEAPYVEVGQFDAIFEAMLCRPPGPTDIPVAFGKLAYRLWQPHVALRRVDRILGDPTGTWTYRGWTLQRAKVGELSISVLTEGAQAGLASRIIASARTVAVDAVGCSSVAPPQLARQDLPMGRPLAAPAGVGSITVCEYDRTRPGAPRMAADLSIRGARARAVLRAIHAAPLGGGPDRPKTCATTMHGDAALVLHFVGRGNRPSPRDPQAFVYSDWCVGNGITEAGGRHALTKEDCRPLYAQPPVLLWSAQQVVAPLCMAGA